jgi:predicted deacylase
MRNIIQLQRVRLAEKLYKIPVAHFGRKTKSKIVITGGVDGDEYTGIETAYSLIRYFRKNPPECEVIIIPTLNLPGFENKTSYNPLDNKYPKHIFPGKINGSSSEQLVYWFSSNYLSGATTWIDLHSGNRTEDLTPFFWTFHTKNQTINNTVLSVLSSISALSIYEKRSNKKAEILAKRGVSYFLLESGKLGQKMNKDIALQSKWVTIIVDTITQKVPEFQTVLAYTSVHEYIAAIQGGIIQNRRVGERVEKKDLLTTLPSEEKKKTHVITAGNKGIILWMKKGESKKGEVVVAVASDLKTIVSE